MPRRNENARCLEVMVDERGKFMRRLGVNAQRRRREIRERAARFAAVRRTWAA